VEAEGRGSATVSVAKRRMVWGEVPEWNNPHAIRRLSEVCMARMKTWSRNCEQAQLLRQWGSRPHHARPQEPTVTRYIEGKKVKCLIYL